MRGFAPCYDGSRLSGLLAHFGRTVLVCSGLMADGCFTVAHQPINDLGRPVGAIEMTIMFAGVKSGKERRDEQLPARTDPRRLTQSDCDFDHAIHLTTMAVARIHAIARQDCRARATLGVGKHFDSSFWQLDRAPGC